MCQMAVVLEWVIVISLGTCTQRWILIKFKGSFKFSLEHLGCLWHLIPLWKSTKRWPRMSPKKDPCEDANNISHSTYCAAREWSFDLLNFCFLKYFCYHGNINSQNPILVQPGGNFFKISSRMLCMHSSNLIAW